MKFSLSLTTLLLGSLVTSEGLSFSFGGQKPLGDGEAVPGNNPLSYCQAKHSDDLLILDHVNLTPNPPEAYVHSLHNILLFQQLIHHQWKDAYHRGCWNVARRRRGGGLCHLTSQIWIDQTRQYPSRPVQTSLQCWLGVPDQEGRDDDHKGCWAAKGDSSCEFCSPSNWNGFGCLLGFQGTYTVFADAYTAEKKKIVCLEATVTFGGTSKHDL